MASQDGVGTPEATTGRRRRSLYEELGLSVDLFEDAAAVPPQAPTGSNAEHGGKGPGGPGGPGGELAHAGAADHRTKSSELDEAESFLAALRDDPPPARGDRGEHADRPSFAEASVRPAFEDRPNAFTPPAGFVPDDPSGAYDSGDAAVPRFTSGPNDVRWGSPGGSTPQEAPRGGLGGSSPQEIPRGEHDAGLPSPFGSAVPLGGTDSPPGDAYPGESYAIDPHVSESYEAEPSASDWFATDTTSLGGTTDVKSPGELPSEAPDVLERRRLDRSVLESLLPVDALAPVDRPRDAAAEAPKSADLTPESVLRQRREQPGRGWRRTLFTLSGGVLNLGPSAAEVRERELVNRARRPLRGCHRLAMISLKGGVGKTTATVCLGSMFAALRGDRVIAMDANPDRGTLGEKIPRTSAKTVRDLVNNASLLTRYADIREFTSQAPSRLEVLTSDADPYVSMAFSETDYRVGVGILEGFYNLILTDCGTGLLHSAMVGVLGLADSLIVVSSASLDGARSASATLDWLEHHGYDSLVRDSVAVISTVHPGGGNVDVGKLEDHFASRCRAVVRIPFDTHLEEGGIIDLDELEQPTYDAYLRLAAEVADGFTPPRLG